MNKNDIEAVLPLSPIQDDAVREGEGNDTAGASWGQFWCEIQGELDVAVLDAAWQTVARRHAVLRTVLVTKGMKSPVQVVAKNAKTSLRTPELPILGDANRDDVVRALVLAEATSVSPFEQALVRLAIVALPDGTWELVGTYHRAALDALSVAILVRELFLGYSELRDSRGAIVASPAPVDAAVRAPSYRDYVAWGRAQGVDAASTWFRARAEDAREAGALALAMASGADVTRVSLESMPLSVSLSKGINALSLTYHVSRTTLLHAAWAVVVGAYAGRSSAVYDARLSGRRAGAGGRAGTGVAGIQAMAGSFATALPMVVRLDADATLATWLLDIEQHRRELPKHAHVSARLAREQSGLAPRELALGGGVAESDAPSWPEGSFGDICVSRFGLRDPLAQGLWLDASFDQEHTLRLTFDARCVEARRAARILSHVTLVLETMVDAMADEDHARVGALTSKLRRESWYLAAEWNQTDASCASELVHASFEAFAARSADRAAIVGDDASVTYGALNRRANALAARLLAVGIARETPVAVFAPGADAAGALAGVLAIWKSGGTCVPIDVSEPFDQICAILDEIQPAAILTLDALQDELPPTWAQIVLLDDATLDGEDAPSVLVDPEAAAVATSAAFVVRGSRAADAASVILEHAAIVAAVEATTATLALTDRDCVLARGSLHVDALVEALACLAKGATIACASSGSSASAESAPRDVLEACRQHAVTIVSTNAASGASLWAELERRAERGEDAVPPSLRLVRVAGPSRAASTSIAWGVAPNAQRIDRVATYGVAEVLVAAIHRAGSPVDVGELALGRPAPHAKVYVLDERGEPVSVGSEGELYVGGRGLARGYWNRPDLDAVRFVRDPILTTTEARIFATGERARMRPDGEIVGVGASPSGAAATSNDASAAYAAPSNPREELLASLWAAVLGVERIGIDDNFFELGGDSMRCIQVLGKAQQHGLEYSLEQLFEHQTVRRLAAVECTVAAEPASRRTAFTLISDDDRKKLPATVEDAYPLSALQKGMLYHSELDPESGVYHEVTTTHLRLAFDEAKWRVAMNALVLRHAVLRTSFDLSTFSEPLQLVHRSVEIPVEVSSLEGLSSEAQDRVVDEAFEAQRQRKIDWTRPPLLRFQIHVRGADTFQMTLTELHMILDGWSAAHMLTELFQHYGALLRGTAYAPEATPVSTFSEFVAMEREALSSASHVSHWKERLEGVSASMLPRLPAAFRTTGAAIPGIVDVAIPAEVASALKDVARAARVPIKSVYLAAHLRVLAALENRQDVLTGLVSNGRPDVGGGERILGLFLNTLPLRQRLEGGTWLELVHETFQSEQASLPFRRYPLAELQKTFGGGQALFDTEFNFTHFHVYQDVAKETEVLRDKAFERNNFTMVTDVNIDAFTSRVRIHLNFDADAIADDQARRIARYYEHTLAAMAADPAARYETFSPVGDDELRLQIVEWNATERAYPDTCLHRLIEAQVAKTPDAIAVVFDAVGEGAEAPRAQWTYRELNARANRLARRLVAEGVGPDSLVAVCAERSLEMVLALLGILKAGAAYVPIDPSYPKDRIRFMLDDCGARVVLTNAAQRACVEGGSAREIALDPELSALADADDAARENSESPSDPGGLAYVIYTSGSTGQPKGVMNTHRGVCNRLLWMQEAYGLTPDDVVLQKTSFSFDVSVWEFFWPLLTGARLVLAKPEGHKDSAYLVDLIARECVTTLHFVPPMLRMWIEEPDVARCASLRRVFCSGEALPFDLQERFFARLATPELHNLYGPTEAAIDVTFWECERDGRLGLVPIGRPIANTQMHVLDAALRPVPIGTAGELHIGGVGLARGYWNRPELTREKFIASPFASAGAGASDARLYKTGDLARYLPNGAIEYLDRLDHQVKIRGFRIELGEIEATLAKHPDVRASVVLARGDGSADKRLVAYIVLEPNAASDAQTLRAFVGATLPEHMVPSAFVMLDALPVTQNGKLDRRALPAPSESRPETGAAFVAPRTPAEEALAAIWATVLGLTRVGVHDNFFSLGGDSIRSLSIAARARACGLAFTLQELFRFPTIAGLVAHAASGVASDASAVSASAPFELVSLEDRNALPPGIEDAYPLATLQAGLVFHSELSPGTAIYHDINTATLRGTMAPAAFRQAVRWMIQRHPILRTSYRLVGSSQPLQLVHAEVEECLEFVDLRALPVDQKKRALDAFLEREKAWRFEWAKAALVRFFVHLLDDATFQYSLSFHDSTLDGWSASAMDTELFQAYRALLDGKTLPTGEQLVPYREFVALEERAMRSDEARAYWLDRLGGGAKTELPRWSDAKADAPLEIRFFEVPIPKRTSDALKQVAQAMALPLKSVLLAVHMKVLGALSGARDVTTGLEHNGRPETVGAEKTLGLFLNTVPFRMRVASGTWADLVRAAYAAETEMLPFRRYPMATLQHALGRGELFEAVFNYTHFHVSQNAAELAGLEVVEAGGVLETQYPFRAEFDRNVVTDDVSLSLHFDTRVFEEAQISAIGTYYARALELVGDDPSRAHESESLIADVERAQVLEAWNTTSMDLPLDVPFARLFEQQVERSPESIAAECGDETLSYAALNQRANRLARALVARGVGKERLVALLMSRSLDLLTAVLAVFKAGAAYVPLDPNHPQERIEGVLTQSGCAVVLCDDALVERIDQERSRALGRSVLTIAPLVASTLEDSDLPSRCGPRNLAYVIFTSGSTGVPKGAMLEHRGMVNHLFAKVADLRLTRADILAQTASQCFDISVWQLLAALIVGGRVLIVRDEIAHETARLLDHVEQKRVSVLETVPSFLRELLDEAATRDPSRTRLAKLRWMMATGEELPLDLCRRWLTDYPAIPIVNAYGPTECSDDVTHHTMVTPPALAERRVSVGAPILNTQIYILDSALVPVPLGSTGELCVGGAGVGRGYLGGREQTADVFVPDPFSRESGARLYRTGDLARFRTDGNIEFVGRVDHQVKIRGFRIELGEIDAVVRRHPHIASAIVVAREDVPGQKRLVAYVVAKAAEALVPAELRAFVKATLPEYMVPSLFVTLPALPLTPNGKVDRRALPTPDAAGEASTRVVVAPRDVVELELVRIWEDLLGRPRIGVRDDFFELGGHSLLAVRLMARVEARFARKLALATLLADPTIEAMARGLRVAEGTVSWSALVPIQPRGSEAPLFCVHPIGGNVLCYASLARGLGNQQPVYALQARGLEADQTPLERVEDMAAAYVDAIRDVKAHGPYALAGWSFGGVVAFEMARQLRARGEVVEWLAMIDSYTDALGTGEPDASAKLDDATLTALVARDLGRSLGKEIDVSIDELRGLDADARWARVLARAKELDAVPPDVGTDRLRVLAQTFAANRRAAAAYRPGSYDGGITHFAATESLTLERGGEATGWEGLAREGVDVTRIAGDHYSIMREESLATAMGAALARARAVRARAPRS